MCGDLTINTRKKTPIKDVIFVGLMSNIFRFAGQESSDTEQFHKITYG